MSYLTEVLDSGICPKCEKPKTDIEEQFSFGVYAGVMCRACAIAGFRDACGHLDGQGDPRDLDEPLDSDDDGIDMHGYMGDNDPGDW